VDFAAGKIEHLLAPSYNLIGFPFYNNGKVYFTRSFEGNDEIFYVQLADREVFKVTEGDMGRYFASVSDDALTYSVFSANGYRLRETDLGKALKEPISAAALQKPAGRFPVAGEKDYTNVRLDLMPSRRFAVRRYNKGKGLLNFHSWRPYYEDPEFTFSLYGENILNTLQTEIYYLYNENENTHAMGFSAVFGGLFPYISAGSEYTFQRTDTLNSQTRKWNQLDTRIGLNFPLNFSGGRFFRFFNIGSSYVLRVENNTGPTRNVFAENTFSYLSHFLSYRQQVQKAVQHINPRLGVNLLLQHRHTITDFNSYQYSGETEIYLPGFYATHSIVMQAAFQQRDTFRIVFSNRIPYARGYNELHFSRMWKLGAEYHFPLWIPDWGFGNILYIQRIRAAGFYDFLKAYSRNKKATADQRSTGVELYFDTQWWNQYPLTFGLRVSRRLDLDLLTGLQATVFEFILPVSIIPK